MTEILKKEIKDAIEKKINARNVLKNEPMYKHSSMRTGGPADYFLTPESEEDLCFVVNLLREEDIPYYVLGRGTNVIVRDEGYRGVIINISGNMSDIKVDGEKVFARAGAKLKDIADAAASFSLSGFEFAAGIPGTLGGALAMNAGAYGGEMKDVTETVRLLDESGKIICVNGRDMDFSYRRSLVTEKNLIVLSAIIKLNPGDESEIRAKIADLLSQRREKQPLEYPSCGSTFKRPKGLFAGKLIMDSGLKGKMIGGAQVSEKHCGFILNKDRATSSNIIALIEYVKDTVRKKQGVELECEVKIL